MPSSRRPWATPRPTFGWPRARPGDEHGDAAAVSLLSEALRTRRGRRRAVGGRQGAGRDQERGGGPRLGRGPGRRRPGHAVSGRVCRSKKVTGKDLGDDVDRWQQYVKRRARAGPLAGRADPPFVLSRFILADAAEPYAGSVGPRLPKFGNRKNHDRIAVASDTKSHSIGLVRVAPPRHLRICDPRAGRLATAWAGRGAAADARRR